MPIIFETTRNTTRPWSRRTGLGIWPEDPLGLLIAGRCCLARRRARYKTAEEYLNRGIKADKQRSKSHVCIRPWSRSRTAWAGTTKRWRASGRGWKTPRAPPVTRKSFGTWPIRTSCRTQVRRGRKGNQGTAGTSLRAGPYKPQRVEFLEARLAPMKGDWKVAKAALDDVLPKLHDNPVSVRNSRICTSANATDNWATSKNRSSPLRKP